MQMTLKNNNYNLSLKRFLKIFEEFLIKFKENKQNMTDNVPERVRRIDVKFRQFFYEQI